MELELSRTEFAYFTPVLRTVVTREETLEMIISDTCPDILRVVETEGVPCLRRQETEEGSTSLSGAVKVTVLYRPEEGTRLWQLEPEIPFQCVLEKEEITASCRIQAFPRLMAVETRTINPRKILVRAELAVEVRVYGPVSMSWCPSLPSEEQWGLQQRLEQREGIFAVRLPETEFDFSDQVNLPGNRPHQSRVLRTRCEAWCGESRLIGAKLIFKGGVTLHVLSQGEDGGLYTSDFEIPFSQIMETEGVGEDAICQTEVALADYSIRSADEEGKTLVCDFHLRAWAVVSQIRTVQLVSDAYSIRYPVECQWRDYQLLRVANRDSCRQSVREVIETGGQATAVHDVRVTACELKSAQDGEYTEFSAGVQVSLLYTSEEDGLTSVSRRLTVSMKTDGSFGPQSVCRCMVQEPQAAVTSGGIELRFSLEFHYCLTESVTLSGIDRFQMDETSPRKGEGASVILRRVTGTEELWDIAKAYVTTVDEIVQANGIQEGGRLGDRILLIPRKR